MTLTELKKSITLFINSYWLREYYMRWKYHRLTATPKCQPMLLAVVDGRMHVKGLTDRFKGIVSVYALAKATNTPFRCLHTHPVDLREFLEPNKYDWTLKEGELSNSVRDVHYRLLRKHLSARRLLNVMPLHTQMRIYGMRNYIDEINKKYNTDYRWGQLFNELFKPTECLERQLAHHRERLGTLGYNACVFRFQSLLGDFMEYKYKALPAEEQKRLIEKNRNALLGITSRSTRPVLVTSDSLRFLEAVDDIENVYTMPGKVVHIGSVEGELPEVYMKSFVDFFMLSRADKVYSIGTKIMYRTDFPCYAAKVNDIPFERILI